MTRIILIFLLVIPFAGLEASKFEELDKPPEGAHAGQMLLCGFVTIGTSIGGIITAEDDFLSGSTYTFSESDITKKLMVSHLAFTFGAAFEYMPLDILGAKARIKRSIIIQKTIFGSQFQNWSETLYADFALLVGPSLHLTTRKQWDVTFAPLVGYAFADYNATPIANRLM